MKELVKQVEGLADEELERSMKNFPLFNSTHEGYAVMLEEVDEVEQEFSEIKFTKAGFWGSIKGNRSTDTLKGGANYIRKHAVLLAAEAIQAAAMAEKFVKSLEKREE